MWGETGSKGEQVRQGNQSQHHESGTSVSMEKYGLECSKKDLPNEGKYEPVIRERLDSWEDPTKGDKGALEGGSECLDSMISKEKSTGLSISKRR